MRGDQTPINKKFIVVSDNPRSYADGNTLAEALELFISMFTGFNFDVNNIIVKVFDLTKYDNAILDNDTLSIIGHTNLVGGVKIETAEMVESFRIGDRNTT